MKHGHLDGTDELQPSLPTLSDSFSVLLARDLKKIVFEYIHWIAHCLVQTFPFILSCDDTRHVCCHHCFNYSKTRGSKPFKTETDLNDNGGWQIIRFTQMRFCNSSLRLQKLQRGLFLTTEKVQKPFFVNGTSFSLFCCMQSEAKQPTVTPIPARMLKLGNSDLWIELIVFQKNFFLWIICFLFVPS